MRAEMRDWTGKRAKSHVFSFIAKFIVSDSLNRFRIREPAIVSVG